MSLKDKIYNIIQQETEAGGASGFSVLVLKDGVEQCFCTYGMRDIEGGLPMERDTIFRLYSQTKPITAAAVILLASEGKIDLSADIADYLPEFGAEQWVSREGASRTLVNRRITVRDLLNMTSGLAYPDDRTVGGKQSGEIFWNIDQRLYTDHPVTTAEFAQMAAKMDLCFSPNEHFMYGISADILGAMVERVSGMKFSDFLKKRFFIPLCGITLLLGVQQVGVGRAGTVVRKIKNVVMSELA